MIGRRLCLLFATAVPVAANAQPITHPLWATTPDATWDAPARAQFEAALAKRGLGPPEVVHVERPRTAPAVDLLAQGMGALRASAYDKAAALLGEAAIQALATGGAGLGPGQPASLFFHQAMAIQLASGATYSEPFTDITPPAAKTAYLRAAVLGGGPSLDEAASQPLVEASWRMAKALAAARPRCALTVNAHPRAKVSIDGRAFQPSPASVSGLSSGEHFVLVEEPGHAPWSTTVDIGAAVAAFDVPATPLLTYDAASAASHARAKGAGFALVGQLHLAGKIEIDLRLLDAQTGELRASTAVPLAEGPESPDLVAAVLRLDEMAGQADLARRATARDGKGRVLLAAPPPRTAATDGPQFSGDTKGWLRQHWPLATAVGAAVGTALALGIVVAKD
jgi:hypothetical protein